jgi:hypothetical protein
MPVPRRARHRPGAHQSSASRFPAEAPGRVPAGDKGNVENVFKVRASTESVRFLINDVVVATGPRAEVGVDGIVGFRINHSLSVHVAALTVAKGK